MQELFFSPVIFLPVHYPSVRSKSKERTSLSVVSSSSSSSSCEICFGAFSLSCFFFRAFICGFDPNPVCLHLVLEIYLDKGEEHDMTLMYAKKNLIRIYNRGLSVLPMTGASDD
jgi:hypothetical protein